MMAPLAQIHLDPLGGIAGDMFVAALADAFPECIPGLLAEIGKLPAPANSSVEFLGHSDGVLGGRRFAVATGLPRTSQHEHGIDRHHYHAHVGHRALQQRLREAGLQDKVLEHALALFALLAEAEGAVHGIAPEDVEFHEVGAWDSIVDFVGAAYLIAALAPQCWTWGPLPAGGGRVHTAHGVLPVPAPATALLLRGMELIDDGVSGERVTPTGAAIVKYLSQLNGASGAIRAGRPQVMAQIGYGFGTRKLPGIPNVLRCLAYAPSTALPAAEDEEIATLQFEIDDQPAEDLAVALERIRQTQGVLEVYQLAAFGKKGRLATQVQILARIDAVASVSELCLAQTTTLGLRISRVWRRTLLRAGLKTAVPEAVRVKVASRPAGKLTAKAEMDDLAKIPGPRAKRERARRRAEAQALERARPYGPTDRKDD